MVVTQQSERASASVKVDGVQLPYTEAGVGTPVLVLPGSDSARAPQLEELLAKRFRVLAFESPFSGPDTLRAASEALNLGPHSLVACGDSAHTALSNALERPDAVASLVLRSPMAPTDDLKDQLPRLAIPTLIVFGTRDREASFSVGRTYRHQLPNVHTALIYAVGRALSVERPEAVAAVVGDFIDRREAFIVNTNAARVHP
jgi:pimeloyl-ACP methyl ester carboxylesterase